MFWDFEKKALLIIFVLGIAFRLTLLFNSQPNLYVDEVSIGYDAYSILKTGKDFHNHPYPTFFESLGEYNSPLYTYLDIPFVYFFGLTQQAERAPAFIFGVLLILLVFFLTKRFFGKTAGLASAFFVSISPWMLQDSWVGWDASTVPFFVALSLFCFFKWLDRNDNLSAFISGAVFALCFYSYPVMRIFSPMLVISLFVIYRNQLWKKRSEILFFITAFAIISVPFVNFLVNDYQHAMARFNQVSALNNYGNEAFSKISSKYVDYLTSLDFWVFNGDDNRRHSPHKQFFIYEFILAIIGFCALFVKKNRRQTNLGWVFGAWFLIFPIAASLTDGTLHALRSQPFAPLPYILAGFAFSIIWDRRHLDLEKIILFALAVLFILQVPAFFIYYLDASNPKGYAQTEQWWFDYGMMDALKYAKAHENEYNQVVITQFIQPIDVAFYMSIPPGLFQNQNMGGYVHSYLTGVTPQYGVLYVARSDELQGYPELYTVRFSVNNATAFKVVSIGK